MLREIFAPTEVAGFNLISRNCTQKVEFLTYLDYTRYVEFHSGRLLKRAN